MGTDTGRVPPPWTSAAAGVPGQGATLPSGSAGAGASPGAGRTAPSVGAGRGSAGGAGSLLGNVTQAGAGLVADELRLGPAGADLGARRRDDVGARRGASAHRLMGAVVRRLLDDADDERVEEGAAGVDEGNATPLVASGSERSDRVEGRRAMASGRSRRAGSGATRPVSRSRSGTQGGGGGNDGEGGRVAGSVGVPDGGEAVGDAPAHAGLDAGAYPGAYAGTRAGAHAGAQAGAQAGVRAGARAGTNPGADDSVWDTPASGVGELRASASVAAPQTRITPVGQRDRLAPDRAVAAERVGRASGMARLSWGALLAAVVALVVVLLIGGFDTPGTEGAVPSGERQGQPSESVQQR